MIAIFTSTASDVWLLADRPFLKRRAFQELRATLAADCREAELAHNRMTRQYLERCVACSIEPSDECIACPVANLCRTAF